MSVLETGKADYSSEKLEAGQHDDWRPVPISNGGGFRDPYHYSNHEDVKLTVPRGLAYLSLSVLFAGSQLPLYFMGGSLSYIALELPSESSSWYVIAFSLAVGAISPFTGYLSDLLSRRYVAILGQVFNCVGTITISSAHSPAQVIVGSMLAGVGSGIGEMSAQAGLGEMVPRKHRGNISALMIVPNLPFCPYVLYCALLGQRHWRDGFRISLAFNLFDLVLLVLFYHPPNEPLPEGVTRKTLLSKIDYLGGLCALSGLTLLLYGLQQGETNSWTKAGVLAPFFLGIALMVAFFIWETKAALPLIPMDLFKANPRVMALTFGITAIAGANFYSLTNFLPLMVSTVWDASNPTRIGLRALGAVFATAFGAIIFAPPLSRFPRHTRYIMLTATILMTGFVAALGALNPDREMWIYPISIFAGLGVGGIVVPAATIAIIASPDSLIGTVTALTLSIRAIGGAIGNAVYFNVFYKQLPIAIPKEIVPRLLDAGLPATSLLSFITAFTSGNTSALSTIPGVSEAVIEAASTSVRCAYSDALKRVFLVSIAFGAASIVAAAFLGNVSEFVDGNQGVNVHRTLHTHEKNSPF